MRSSLTTLPLLATSLPVASAQLHKWAKKAGFLYFGAATDTPGQRERAVFEEVYPQYDAILANNDEFGQTTPTNGQKVDIPPPPTINRSSPSTNKFNRGWNEC
jgi:endo-1,4-beta-xylanase